MTGGFGADYTFEATGNVAVMRQAVEAARMGWGLCTVAGVAGKGETLDIVPRLLITGRRVAGSSFGGVKGRDQVPQLVDRYLDGEIDVDPFISHRIDARRGQPRLRADGGPGRHPQRDRVRLGIPRCRRGSTRSRRRAATGRSAGPATPATEMVAVTSIMRVHQILMARLNELLEPFGLTFPRYEALMLLHFSRRGSLPLGKIGERLQVHRTSVTNTIDGLERVGLVRRRPARRATAAPSSPRSCRDGRRGRRGRDRGAQRRPTSAPSRSPTRSSSDLFATAARRCATAPATSAHDRRSSAVGGRGLVLGANTCYSYYL